MSIEKSKIYNIITKQEEDMDILTFVFKFAKYGDPEGLKIPDPIQLIKEKFQELIEEINKLKIRLSEMEKK